jgi:hypothetical protein
MMFFRTTNAMFALVSFFSLAVPGSRAAISQSCQDELEVLDADGTLSVLRSEVLASVNRELTSCSSSTCTVDFSGFTSDLEAACLGMGGQVFKLHTTQSCTAPGIGKVQTDFNNQALCVGQSCDENGVEELQDAAFDRQDDRGESMGFTSCTSDTEVEGSSSGSNSPGVSAAAIMASSALIASTVLLL